MESWVFHTPGFAGEEECLPASTLRAWDAWHREEAASNIDQMRTQLERAGHDPQRITLPYANPAVEEIPAHRTPTPVPWDGFPKRLTDQYHDDPAAAAAASELRGYADLRAHHLVDEGGRLVDGPVRYEQDEYLEWDAQRDQDGRLVGVTFVAEGYDYWAFLFDQDPLSVVEAFRESAQNSRIGESDLRAASNIYKVDANGNRSRSPVIPAGSYNWRHAFNQGPGIRHLSHRANSLGAEVNLAVTSCLPRETPAGKPVDASSPERLMCCTQGGDPNRSSDPRIAALAYAAVTGQPPHRFTLTDPIGLYIASMNIAGIKDPGGGDAPLEMLNVERGTGSAEELASGPENSQARVLRLRISAPPDAGYALGDMTIDRKPITRGAQLAQLVKMHLFVDAWPVTDGPPPIPCGGRCCRHDGRLIPIESWETCAEGEDAFPDLQANDAPAVMPASERLSRRMV